MDGVTPLGSWALLGALVGTGSFTAGVAWRLSRTLAKVYEDVAGVRQDMAVLRGEVGTGHARLEGRIESLGVQMQANGARLDRTEKDFAAIEHRCLNACAVIERLLPEIRAEVSDTLARVMAARSSPSAPPSPPRA